MEYLVQAMPSWYDRLGIISSHAIRRECVVLRFYHSRASSMLTQLGFAGRLLVM
jgi:hypothetical protein